MKRAPAALAIALALSGFRTVGAEPCAPRAELAGDGGAVARVAEELRRLGVLVTSRPNDPGAARGDGCLTVHAQVALDDGGRIAVAVRGASQGSEGRVVSDAALAAAWIDSWTREDVDLALWAAPPASAAPPLAPPGAERPRTAPSTATTYGLTVAATYEQTWSDDGVTWRGAGVASCVRVGAFCLGARARVGFDARRTVSSTAVARSDLALLATASYPITVGAMVIAPELGVGFGRLVTKRADGGCAPAPPPNCDPMDPSCVMPPTPCDDPTNPGSPGPSSQVLVGDGFRATSYTPRISLALRIAVPLARAVWLDGLAGLSLSPLGHATSYLPEMSPVTAIVPAAQLALPGEPQRGYQLGVGLRVGR